MSRTAGVSRITAELEPLGIELAPVRSLANEVHGDLIRGQRYANNYARQWVKKAEGATVERAAKAANADTLSGLTRTAVTESAQAFGDGRAKALEGLPIYEGRPSGAGHVAHSLLKVWDATLDKQTCPICFSADGTIVGIREPFPQGTPGAVHPNCRCTWTALQFSEQGDQGYIEPREPAKVISLPVRPPVAAPPIPAPSAKPLAAIRPAKPAIDRQAIVAAKTAERAAVAAARKAERAALSEAKLAQAAAEKQAEKEIKATLKTYGVRASGDVRGTLKDIFGRVPHPDEIRGALGVESLGKLGRFRGDVDFGFSGIQFRGGTSNGAVSISRKISKANGKVSARHEALFLSKAAQGQKIGAAILREQVGAYEKLGVNNVTLNSAEVGRYYWPKIGFDAPGTLGSAKTRLGKWLEAQGLPAEIAAKPATMREIATLQIGERKIGKEFLLSPDYPGNHLELDLTPGSSGLEIFKREVGLPGAER